MKSFLSFLESYGIFIWLGLMVSFVLILYFTGRRQIREFGNVDYSKARFYEKFASGYSTKSWKTKRGGASRTLHILITDDEFILKTFMFVAYVAKRHDLLHRIPLKNVISAEVRRKLFQTELLVTCTTEEGEMKKFVLISAAQNRIKELLDEAISKNPNMS
ncbi:MAG: hypothetical protein AB8B56_03190 [Crocinitomicaceae bacterium]